MDLFLCLLDRKDKNVYNLMAGNPGTKPEGKILFLSSLRYHDVYDLEFQSR